MAALALFALTFIVYSDVLGHFFTGRDAISFVAEGRIRQPLELTRFFTQRQFSGSSFPGRFYRPISSLSFAFDYALWGLDPRGYHFTDLLIHAAVGILTYLLGRRLLRLSWWASLLGAALFVVHPTHQGIVPVIARRIDPIAALLAFLSLLLFAEAFSPPRLSQSGQGDEGAEAQPGQRPDSRQRGMRAKSFRAASWVAYALALLAKETAIVVPAILALWAVSRSSESRRSARWLAGLTAIIPFIVISLAYLIVRALLLGGLGGYPDRQPLALAPAEWLIMVNRYTGLLFNPLSYRVPGVAARNLMAAVTACLVVALAHARARFAPAESLGGGSCNAGYTARYLVGVFWIVLQLILLLAAQVLAVFHTYVALAWLGLLLAGLIEDGWALLQPAPLDSRGWPVSGLRHPPSARLLGLFGLVWGSVFVLGAFRASPLFEHTAAWRDTGESQRKFLAILEDNLSRVPEGTRVELINLPFVQPKDPWEREVALLAWLADYSIQDWLALRYPQRKWDLKTEFNISTCSPLDFTFTQVQPSPGVVQFHIAYPCPSQ